MMNPGETLTGQGQLLQHGRLIAHIDYHLTIPSSTHFVINPTGKLKFDFDDYLAGFVLISPADADNIEPGSEYTLELQNKTKLPIRIDRRYKQVERKKQTWISFWVSAL